MPVVAASIIWLPAALTGGFVQAWRTAAQARLRSTLSVNAAALVRYLFGFPFACLIFGSYLIISNTNSPPSVASMFWFWCASAGLAQIVATNLLLRAFAYRNFVVGTAYSKTEALQTALFAWIILGEALPFLAWVGIAIGVGGILMLSLKGEAGAIRRMITDLGSPVAIVGMASGLFFGITAVFIKLASRQVESENGLLTALTILVTVLGLQALMQGGYVFLREREQYRHMWHRRGLCTMTGLLAAVGSACWFTGFVFAPVALVRIVGQVETIFTLLFGHFYLNEAIAANEMAGLLLIGLGIVLALAATL